MTPNNNLQNQIKHVFVVMLENRSFDHMLGLSNIRGIDAVSGRPAVIEGLNANNDWNLDQNGNKISATSPADWAMPYDPGHEFNDVKDQLCGPGGIYPYISNSGFVTSYSKIDPAHPGEIMKCYAPDQLPVLTALAQEFAVCDHWFSSMPGPTWPNRFFVHAASSGGLDHSPSALESAGSILLKGYTFEHGTIYDRLDKANLSWTIYKGDAFPQALAISGMNIRDLQGRFRDYGDFSADLKNPNYTTSYAFIEPNYGHVLIGDFTCGNSQHPKDDVTRGEGLLKSIYETIRNSPLWNNSLLIITYDEHGGFYDHVPPPQTVAPGDATTDPGNNTNHFDFTQLGVRVPAVIISPLIPKGLIDSTVYDHSSVLATVESIFGLTPLTERDKQANTLNHLFSLTTPRNDAPTTLPAPANSGIRCDDNTGASTAKGSLGTNAASATGPIPPSLQGFLHVAYLRDLQATPQAEQANLKARFSNIKTQLDARRYMDEVRQKFEPPNAT
jgi:phospholipase C